MFPQGAWQAPQLYMNCNPLPKPRTSNHLTVMLSESLTEFSPSREFDTFAAVCVSVLLGVVTLGQWTSTSTNIPAAAGERRPRRTNTFTLSAYVTLFCSRAEQCIMGIGKGSVAQLGFLGKRRAHELSVKQVAASTVCMCVFAALRSTYQHTHNLTQCDCDARTQATTYEWSCWLRCRTLRSIRAATTIFKGPMTNIKDQVGQLFDWWDTVEVFDAVDKRPLKKKKESNCMMSFIWYCMCYIIHLCNRYEAQNKTSSWSKQWLMTTQTPALQFDTKAGCQCFSHGITPCWQRQQKTEKNTELLQTRRRARKTVTYHNSNFLHCSWIILMGACM